MPFSEESRAIACRLQSIGHRSFGEWQSLVAARGSDTVVVFVAESLWVSPRHETRARWAAVRAGDVAVRESRPPGGQGVDIGRRNVGTTVNTDVRVTHVVGDDDDDVRWSRLGVSVRRGHADGRQRGKGCGEYSTGESFHDNLLQTQANMLLPGRSGDRALSLTPGSVSGDEQEHQPPTVATHEHRPPADRAVDAGAADPPGVSV